MIHHGSAADARSKVFSSGAWWRDELSILPEERFVIKSSCCGKSSIDMGRFSINTHVVKLLVPNMAKSSASDSNYIMVTDCGVPIETEEWDNRSRDFMELFL